MTLTDTNTSARSCSTNNLMLISLKLKVINSSGNRILIKLTRLNSLKKIGINPHISHCHTFR
jgi:hypothetical protein